MTIPGFTSGKIGIGIPGPVEYENGIYHTNNRERYGTLENQNIKALLAEQLGVSDQNIKLINDAASFFHGEVIGGAARCYKKSFGLTLRIGLGLQIY